MSVNKRFDRDKLNALVECMQLVQRDFTAVLSFGRQTVSHFIRSTSTYMEAVNSGFDTCFSLIMFSFSGSFFWFVFVSAVYLALSTALCL